MKRARSASPQSTPDESECYPGVGDRLEIYREETDTWFAGEVTAADGVTAGLLTVLCEGGGSRVEDLREQQWRVLAEAEEATPAPVARGRGRTRGVDAGEGGGGARGGEAGVKTKCRASLFCPRTTTV